MYYCIFSMKSLKVFMSLKKSVGNTSYIFYDKNVYSRGNILINERSVEMAFTDFRQI